MGARGFRLTEDQRTEMKTALEVAKGNKDYSVGLKLRSVLAAGKGRRQREVAAVFNTPLRALEWWIQTFRSAGLPGLVNGPYLTSLPVGYCQSDVFSFGLCIQRLLSQFWNRGQDRMQIRPAPP